MSLKLVGLIEVYADRALFSCIEAAEGRAQVRNCHDPERDRLVPLPLVGSAVLDDWLAAFREGGGVRAGDDYQAGRESKHSYKHCSRAHYNPGKYSTSLARLSDRGALPRIHGVNGSSSSSGRSDTRIISFSSVSTTSLA
jgi:hypothetical protein